jgi:hypothetical protein
MEANIGPRVEKRGKGNLEAGLTFVNRFREKALIKAFSVAVSLFLLWKLIKLCFILNIV